MSRSFHWQIAWSVMGLWALLGPAAEGAELPDALLPPMVRPMARISTQLAAPDQHMAMMMRRGRYNGNLTQAAFSADGKLLVVSDGNGNGFQLVDATTGKGVRALAVMNVQPLAAAFSPDGKALVASETSNQRQGGAVRVWDLATGKDRLLDEGVSQALFTAIACSPDGKTLALTGFTPPQGNTLLTLWDAASGDEIRQLPLPQAAAAVNPQQRGGWKGQALAFSPDGKSLAFYADNQLTLLEVSTGKVRTQATLLPGGRPEEPDDNTPFQTGSAGSATPGFSPDGRFLAVGSGDETIRLFDVLAGRELPPLAAHRSGVRAICFSPDGKALKSLGWDGKLLIWRTANILRPWQPQGQPLSAEVLTALWEELNTDDPWLAHAVKANLAARPTQAVAMLRDRLKPAPMADTERITKLAGDLDNGDYNTRKRAAAALRKLGESSIPVLRHLAEQGNSEVLAAVLERLDQEKTVTGPSRALPAVDILEQVGNAEAREVLTALTKGAANVPLTLRAKAALERLEKKTPDPKEAVKLDGVWADLGKADAQLAFRALRTLVSRPREATPLLRERTRAMGFLKAPDDDPRRVMKLVLELESEDFAVRDKAMEELKKLGARAEKIMRQRLKDGPPADLVKRVEELLKEIAQPTPLGEVVHLDRALEALERIGTKQAREVLQELVKEASNPVALEMVRASLQRVSALQAADSGT